MGAPIASPASRLPSVERPDDAACAREELAPLDDEALGDLAHRLAALADPIRLRIVAHIARSGPLCSCQLEEPVGRSQPTISHHTAVLARAGILVAQRRGRWTWWQLAPTALADMASTLVRGAAITDEE